jgi:hypothetical protein
VGILAGRIYFAAMIAFGLALPAATASSEADTDCVVAAVGTLPKVNSPATLHDSFLAFRGCDNGAGSALFPEAVTGMLTLQWPSVSQMQSIAATDPPFKEFILRHIDATTPPETLRRIAFNAQRQCPDQFQSFCAEPPQAAEVVLRGIPAVADETAIACEDAAAAPHGHYMVLACERQHDKETPHEFRLEDLRTGEVIWSYQFRLWAEALWSPDGSSLAITDHAGSNSTQLFLVIPGPPKRTVDIQAETARSLDLLPSVTHNLHVYFEAVGWKDPETLAFRIWGYGDHDPQGFDESFEYRLGGEVVRTRSGPAGGR